MRLIDADALRQRMYREAFETDTDMQKLDSGCWIRYKLFENCIESAPTISPDEVRGVGEWRNKVMAVPGGHGQTYSRWGCSVCKKKFKERSNYCPNCGAKMEVSEDD